FLRCFLSGFYFFFQAEDGIRDFHVTGVQTCALPIYDGTLNVYANRVIMSAVSSVDITSPVNILEDTTVWESLTVRGSLSAREQLTLYKRGVSNGLALEGVSGNHVIVGHNTTGAFHIYPNRES